VGEAFGRIIALAHRECDIHGLDERPGIVCPPIKGKQRSHLVCGNVRGGAVKVGALLVQHRAGCRKPLRVKVVRTYPHTFPELREVQGQRGFPELEAIGCRPTM
jgi:hypothetical protein